jgi:hypothetical protein
MQIDMRVYDTTLFDELKQMQRCGIPTSVFNKDFYIIGVNKVVEYSVEYLNLELEEADA